MTDEQIIEALEWCTYLDNCVNCPYYKKRLQLRHDRP